MEARLAAPAVFRQKTLPREDGPSLGQLSRDRHPDQPIVAAAFFHELVSQIQPLRLVDPHQPCAVGAPSAKKATFFARNSRQSLGHERSGDRATDLVNTRNVPGVSASREVRLGRTELQHGNESPAIVGRSMSRTTAPDISAAMLACQAGLVST